VDSLTVRQTPEFYAAVKGFKNFRVNVDQVLGVLDIKSFANSASKALSGGT
jgi:ABC-type multidrug transport system ATPase subunit